MATPKENAEIFSTLWQLERPASIPEQYRQLLEDAFKTKEPKVYGGTDEDIERRKRSAYTQLAVEKLRGALNESCVTEPCRDYVFSRGKGNIELGAPPAASLSLELLGIDIAAGKYGIFDPAADLRLIEAELLQGHNAVVNNSGLQDFAGGDDIELNRRWNEAFMQKYEKY